MISGFFSVKYSKNIVFVYLNCTLISCSSPLIKLLNVTDNIIRVDIPAIVPIKVHFILSVLFIFDLVHTETTKLLGQS